MMVLARSAWIWDSLPVMSGPLYRSRSRWICLWEISLDFRLISLFTVSPSFPALYRSSSSVMSRLPGGGISPFIILVKVDPSTQLM